MANYFTKQIIVDGTNLNSFIHIEEIKKPLITPHENTTSEIPSIDGSLYRNNKLKSFPINVSFAIIGSEEEILQKKRELAKILSSKKIQKIQLISEQDVYYEGKLDGEISLDNEYHDQHIEGSFSFLIFRPYAFSNEVFTSQILGGESTIELDTAIETEPTINLEITENTSSISIVGVDEVFTIGTPIDIEKETSVDLTPIILQDDMSTTSSWAQGGSDTSWSSQNSLTSNGYSFQQETIEDIRNYGTGSKWHGGVRVKSLGSQLEDYEVTTRVEMKSSKVGQVGRIEVLGLDIDGNEIFKMAIADSSDTLSANYIECRLGTPPNTNFIHNAYGANKSVWSHFLGTLVVRKVGLFYTFNITNLTGGTAHSRRSVSKTYTVPVWYGKKLAQIKVRIGQYGSKEPTSLMAVHDVVVKELKKAQPGQIDEILKAGDILKIDSEKGQVFLNDDLYLTNIFEMSQFIKLKPGINELQVHPLGKSIGTVEYRKRYI